MFSVDFWLIIAFFVGIGATIVFYWASDKRARSLVNRANGLKGVEAKADAESRLMSFLLEVKATYDAYKAEGGTDLKEFGMKKLPAVALKYPDVLMKQGRKLMKLLEGEGLSGLTEFF